MNRFWWRMASGIVIGGVVIGSSITLAQGPKEGSESGSKSAGVVTIDVKETDIARVLDAFSQQTGLSVVVGKEVTGNISVRLFSVPWDRALDAILKPYGFGYERSGDVVVVMPLAKLQELNDAQPLSSRVFNLHFLDAGDVKPIVEAQLSPRGKAQVVEETGQKGWAFGSFGVAGASGQANRSGVGSTGASGGQPYRTGNEKRSKSKRLVVTDISSILDRVETVITSIDVMPQQVLIESRFMEVNRDRLKDFGLDVSTGSTGTSSSSIQTTPVDKDSAGNIISSVGGHILGSLASPAAFGARSSDITSTNPFNTGLSLAFKKFTGTQFDVLVHALEEDVHTNTLSAPSIMTLDNQEANILVGT